MKILLILLLMAQFTFAQEKSSTWNTFKTEWQSPYYDDEAWEIFKIGAGITAAIVLNRETHFDKIQHQMHEDEPMGKYSFIGDYGGKTVPNLIYMGWWYYKGNKKRFWLMTKATLYSGMTTTVLKRIANQPRPHRGDNNSFPSGHTTTAFAFASVVGMEHEIPYGIAAYGLATWVGLSRMNDNAHYLHDVTFGATLGISYGVALWNRMQKKEKGELKSSFDLIPFEDGAMTSYIIRW